jgi:hypothetical protein
MWIEASRTGEGIMRYKFVSIPTLAKLSWSHTRLVKFEDSLRLSRSLVAVSELDRSPKGRTIGNDYPKYDSHYWQHSEQG